MAHSEPIDVKLIFKPMAKVKGTSVKPLKKNGRPSKGAKTTQRRKRNKEDIYDVLEKRAQEPSFDTKIEPEPRFKRMATSPFPPLPPIRGGIGGGYYRY